MKTRTEIIEEALALCATLPIRTVAKNLHIDHPEHFRSVEVARSALRDRRGANGRAPLKSYGKERKLSTIAEGISKLRRQLPEKDLDITIKDAQVLVINDLHIPYHDPEAVSIALEYCEPDVIILNGDIVDFYGISRFSREIGRMTVNDELAELRKFLQLLRDEFPDTRIIYKIGNHEERLWSYLLSQAKEIRDLDALKFENISGCKDLGIEIVRTKRIMLGKLSLLHGHELPHGMVAPVNPARGVYLRTHASTMVGHHHQVSHHSENDLNNKAIGCWSVGCLCRLTPEYNPFAYTKWSHGFAVVDVDSRGMFTVHNKMIVNGEVR